MGVPIIAVGITRVALQLWGPDNNPELRQSESFRGQCRLMIQFVDSSDMNC